MHTELTPNHVPLPTAPRGLADWVTHLREQDMPAFGHTVTAIHALVEDDSATANRLAGVILRDPATTTKVLRLANSAYFNVSNQGVSTISRAIVVLGFDAVAHMAIGLALVDATLRGGVRTRVEKELARCFLAASLARGVARMRGEGAIEEVFIAALLSRIGEMAFWCFGGAQANMLDTQLSDIADCAEDLASQQAVLGFRLPRLSLQLAREWHLGSLLMEVLNGGARLPPRAQAVRHGLRVARAISLGDDNARLAQELEDLAIFVDRPADELQTEIAALAADAARLAAGFGVAGAVVPRLAPAATAPIAADPAPAISAAEQELGILRELSMLVASGGKFVDVIYLVAEGMLQVAGFARVVVALLSPDRKQLSGKIAIGKGSDALRARFTVALGICADAPFDRLIADGQARRFDRSRGPLMPKVSGAAGVAPISGQGRCVGVIYAERGDDAAALDDTCFHAFLHFAQYATLALNAGTPLAGKASPV